MNVEPRSHSSISLSVSLLTVEERSEAMVFLLILVATRTELADKKVAILGKLRTLLGDPIAGSYHRKGYTLHPDSTGGGGSISAAELSSSSSSSSSSSTSSSSSSLSLTSCAVAQSYFTGVQTSYVHCAHHNPTPASTPHATPMYTYTRIPDAHFLCLTSSRDWRVHIPFHIHSLDPSPFPSPFPLFSTGRASLTCFATRSTSQTTTHGPATGVSASHSLRRPSWPL